MKTYKIESELFDNRAIIRGAYSDLRDGNRVVIEDAAGNEYNAVVQTRGGFGFAVVRVLGFR
jgi:hypothetical protein